MSQAERLRCPKCGAYLILVASPSDGKGSRIFQCFECDRPDPIKTNKVMGWLTTAAEVKVMADYRAYTVGYDGHFSDCEARTCDEDRDAIEGAKQLVKSYAIELWCGERLVAKLNLSRNN